MTTSARAEVTQLLQAWSHGDQTARDTLWPIVFGELQRLAHRAMKQERPNHTLQTAALVNEAYVRLVGWKNARWKSRAHFYAMCARIMRQILVDYARARRYQRRGGDSPIESLDESIVASPCKSDQLIALDEALTRLAAAQPRKAAVIELRFFAGLSVDEVAQALDVSRMTVIRDWNFSRAWLLAEMNSKESPNHA